MGDERRVVDAGRRREVEEEGGREIDAPAALQPGGIERWMGGCGSLFVHPFQAGLEGKVIEFGGASKGVGRLGDGGSGQWSRPRPLWPRTSKAPKVRYGDRVLCRRCCAVPCRCTMP